MLRIKLILFACYFGSLCSFASAQAIDSTREVRLILVDIPYNGLDVHPVFEVKETGELLHFNPMSWQVPKLNIHDFHERYDDLFQDSVVEFNATIRFQSVEQFEYIRFEGYTSLGTFKNEWTLIDIQGIYHFNTLISTAIGDLNKDGIPDIATITQDTASHTKHYHLEVFFTLPNGDKQRIVSNTEAIEPRLPHGNDRIVESQGHSTLSIRNGVLWIETEFIRGHMDHKFRYQNGHFELIGYSSAGGSAGAIELVDFNLSTGRRIEKLGAIGSDTYTLVSDEIIKIRPLPALEHFAPYKGDYE